MKNKKLLKVMLPSVAAIVLASGGIAGATYALFTSQANTNIAITAGKVKLTAGLSNVRTYSGLNLVGDPTLDTEWTDDLHGAFIDGGSASLSADGSTLSLDRIVPGDKVVFDLTVQNQSNVSIKWRYSYQVTSDNGLASGLQISFDGAPTVISPIRRNGNWMTVDVPSTKVHEVTILLPSDKGNEYQEKTCNIRFGVEGVQANAFTEDVDFEIGSKEDLLSLRDSVNAGADYTGTVIGLTSDIDMAGVDWYPIGTTAHPFKGVFDGGDHLISNLAHTGAFTGTQFGLFGVTQGTANATYNSLESVWQNEDFVYDTISEDKYTTVIKNLVLEDVAFVNDSSSGSNRHTGGLVGGAYNTYIDRVAVTGSVQGVKGVGGIAGALEGSVVSNCVNNAEILATGYNVGGLVGGANYMSGGGYNAIVKSTNNGDVTTTIDNGYAGGILGIGQGYNLTVINDCDNSGDITALGKTDCLGGIVGFGLHTGLVNNCENTGSITATQDINYAGGIVGKGAGYIYNSVNSGDITVSANYLTGIFTYDTNEGGKAGFIKNCSNSGTLTNNKAGGKIYDLGANCAVNVIVNKTFANVTELNQFTTSNDTLGIELVGCTVTDNTGTLALNSSVTSVIADSKICSDVSYESASQTSLTIDIPELEMSLDNNYAGTITFAGTNNIVTIPEGVTVGALVLTGTGQQFTIAGTANRVSLSSTGDIAGEVTTTGKVLGSFSFGKTGTYVLTNRGLISHNGGGSNHTLSTITACTITIHNYGTLEAKNNGTGSCGYTCLWYGGCVVKVHQYYGSAIVSETAGMTLACGSAQSVIYYTYDATGTLTGTVVHK